MPSKQKEMKINEKNLSYFATTEPFDKCGLLNKRGELNKVRYKIFNTLPSIQ